MQSSGVFSMMRWPWGWSGIGLACVLAGLAETACALDWIEVSPDRKGFVQRPSGRAFVPWGVNYDHDEQGRLLEDYWDTEWSKVESDFAEIQALGANVVRIHLQVGRFLTGPETAHQPALHRLKQLLQLAERLGLYLDLTGLGCYHKQDVPEWYDALSESARWNAQAFFWTAVAECCAGSPAVFCYDLMNEPVVPGGRRPPGDWLGPPFAGKHFVQFIVLDQGDRPRTEIARQWIAHLVEAIRQVDPRHLVTVGLVDWSLDRPGLTSGFVPEKTTEQLDFLCVHLYPESGKLAEAHRTLRGFSVGKPVVVEETFPLKCSPRELAAFIRDADADAAGWISFYWGRTPDELRQSTKLADALLLEWLEWFAERGRQLSRNP
jgi:hypothetical protein